MTPEEWTFAVRLDELEDGKPTAVKVDGEEILLLRRGDRVHACGARCTHWNYPLERGVAEDTTLTCPWHGARFDAETGEATTPPAMNHLGCYSVKIDDGDVYVGTSTGPSVVKASGDDRREFVIVGAGAAGIAAATTLRQQGFEGTIRVISRESELPYDRTLLSKQYLQGHAPPDWLTLQPSEFYEDHDVELMRGRSAVGLDPGAKAVKLEGGDSVHYDALLCATGGDPIHLPIPGHDFPRYYRLRDMEDASRLENALEEAEKAVLLGAGFVCLEVATVLRKKDIEVDVVAPEEVLFQPIFGERVGRWLQRRHEEDGVTFHLGHTPSEVRGAGRVEEVVMDDGTVLPADMVVSGVGVRPAVEWLEESGITQDGVVPVDDRLHSRAEDVYAAGDMAAVPSPLTGRHRRVEHWAEAQQQANHAARMMLGGDEAYGGIPYFWTEQAGVSLKHVGGPTKWDNIVVRGELEDGEFLVAYYGGDQLRAVCAAGLDEELLACRRLLESGRNPGPEEFAKADKIPCPA